MKKISIVGVDGSGKTVLMTALGDKYEKPDEFGIFLSPETPEAFGYVKVHMTRLHHGQWPSSTVVGQSSVLDWGLFRQNGTERVRLCDLSFLDFSGEVYRLAFGAKGDHDDATYTDKDVVSGIGTLQTHLQTSDTLLVLVNLKDIINGNAEEARTREAMWLSKGILDYAIDKLQIRHVAVAFTQADAYRATMDACDNVKNVYKTYLPFVASKYPDLPLFAVSAVNKTVPDDKGLPCPAEGFGSEGLDLLMEWIVSTVPGCENLISDIKKAPALFP